MSCGVVPWLPIQLAPEDCDFEVVEPDKTGSRHCAFHAAENSGGEVAARLIEVRLVGAKRTRITHIEFFAF
jgi:hypothetical protein